MNKEQKRAADNLRDSDLVEKHRNGDKLAFAQIMNQYQNIIYLSCFKILNNHDEAQEATQQAFIKFLNAINARRYKKIPTIAGWLKVTAWHCAAHIRDNNPNSTEKANDLRDLLPMEDNSNDEEMALQTDENKKFLRKLLRKLSRKDKKIITLRIIKNKSFKIIGDLVDITEKEASSRYSKIKKEILNSMNAFILARKKTYFH